MASYEATFEVESNADARAVRRLMERTYDTLREELREIDHGDASPKETLQQFEALRAATRERSRGTLTVTYETGD